MRALHLQNWCFTDIMDHLDQVKGQGFDTIIVGPVQPTKRQESDLWWMLYQPIDFSIGNRLANRSQFMMLCKIASQLGIKVIVDVVLRHVASQDFNPLYPHENVNKFFSGREKFLQPINGNPNDRWQMINRCFDLPAVNYFNSDVIEHMKEFLEEVLLFADGIRIDEAKHFGFDYEGSYFWNMIEEVKDCYENKIVIGECINLDRHWMDEYAKYCLCLAEKCTNPSDKDNQIAFFESHDTYLSLCYTRNLNDQQRLMEYRNLTNSFKNTLFYARPFDDLAWSKEIRDINKGWF